MDSYSGIQFGQQGYVGKTNYTGNVNANQNVDVTQLQEGDTFKGEIASVNGEDVQILLTNGQYMSARLERDVQVALGQILNLQVQSNKDNKIVLKPLADSNAQFMRVGEAALRAANMSVNSKNLNLISNLLQNGMSIDKNTVSTYNRLSLQNPEVDISVIIGLNKLKVPVTQENVNQLQNYENMQHRILDGVDETADEVINLYDSISSQEGGQKIAGKFMEQVVNLLANGEVDETDDTQLAQPESSKMESANTQSAKSETVNPESANTESVKSETIKSESESANDNIQADNTTARTQQRNDLAGDLTKTATTEISNRIIKYISDGKLDIKDVKQLLKDNNLGTKLSDEQKAEIFKSEPFKNLVKNGFLNRWTLTPEQISKNGRVEEFYERLARETSKLSKVISDAVNDSGQDVNLVQAKSASNISDNIQFINQLNHMMNYVQLPLMLTGSKAHGDLYVYTNKKNMASNDGILTAFLHLDMDHLGPIDVSIALQTDKNHVTTKFYLNESTLALVDEHKEELVERLANKGYKCDAMMFEQDESMSFNDKTVIEHLEEQVSGQSAMIGYRTFDTRA